jgi:putative pyoverdin transport system ATP-binding/permease protein
MSIIKLFWDELGSKAFIIMFLSMASGGISAATISVVNDLLMMKDNNKFVIFIALILITLVLSKINSEYMLRINSKIIYRMRTKILSKVQNISLKNFEEKNKENESFVYGVLTRDIDTLGGLPGQMIGIITDVFLVIGCFIYLGIQSITGTLIMIIMIGIALTVFNLLTRGIRKYDQAIRKLIDVHFDNVNTLVRGFREFKLDQKKQDDFKKNYMDKSSEDIKSYRLKFGIKMINANLANHSVIYSVICAIIFFNAEFGLFGRELQSLFILTFIFISGPIEGLNGAIPFLVQVETSLLRVKEIENFFDSENEVEKTDLFPLELKWNSITFKDVFFSYNTDNNRKFHIGPINVSLYKGETIFICGGNGSGKTTFMNLILSLYEPNKGKIYINEKYDINADKGRYRELFSVIFSDNYLFQKFYGYQDEVSNIDTEAIVSRVKLSDKVHIKNSEYSTIDLSSGQRKRLALISAFVEDKEIIVMDEFTADQDPMFREYFYNYILPELKSDGKTVIIITHDDRYFNHGDRLLKMEEGILTEVKIESDLKFKI